MKALVIRVNKANVKVKERVIASIGKGIVIFLGLEKEDTSNTIIEMAEKIVNLRIFENEENKLTYSIKDIDESILCIPNFTLCANIDKGRRPSFERAMSKEEAKKYFENFIMVLKSKGVNVEKGEFGEHMDIILEIDGPVNIILGE
ncbi:MAG: D-aminoacyl-tRNA deacylase [Candidatus Omnitrophica bacterium]|nr:D-aminoacyl-tRNA deacylase [Candidatus Omnitrophota bacterium]MCM8827167.1 D-aminoacyl-tRNA deacylase [Candidatus Omnitrophota bacterium]